MNSVFLKAGALLLAFAILFVPGASTQTGSNLPFDRKLSKKDEDWVRKTLASLTLAEKIGQMIIADANIVFWNRESEEYKKLIHHIMDNKVGGVILYRSEVWPVALITNRWQEMAKLPLLISADLEMGPGMRLDDTPWWVPNMAVAATGDPKWARLQGEATALQARAIGINWLFAPAADVNNNPDNPVINTRSFGEDPATVAKFTRAFIEGAQSAGALSCAKHFPGHGDTATDSHIGLPVVDVSRERLEKLELVPFRAAIEAGVGSVMSAHIALPQVETELAAPVRPLSEREAASAEFLSQTEANVARVTLPATLSSKIMTGLLRNELKFNGLIVTDAMGMAGVAARYTPAEAAVKAIKAGADVIEKSPDIDAAVAGIKEAMAKGELTEARINASVERVLRAKAALGLRDKRAVDLNEVDRVVSNPRFNEIAQQIADRSITLVRDEGKLLPLDAKGRVLNITFTDEEDRAITKVFTDELRARAAIPKPFNRSALDRSGDLAPARKSGREQVRRGDLLGRRSRPERQGKRRAAAGRKTALRRVDQTQTAHGRHLFRQPLSARGDAGVTRVYARLQPVSGQPARGAESRLRRHRDRREIARKFARTLSARARVENRKMTGVQVYIEYGHIVCHNVGA